MTTKDKLPNVVTRNEWFVARRELLSKEKELTNAHDRLNADRRRLPMVHVEESYTFSGPDGPVGLLDLFDGRQQLVMHHFMFGPDWEQPCPFVDNDRRLVFALAYNDLPREAELTTVSPSNAVRRTHLDIVRYPKATGGN